MVIACRTVIGFGLPSQGTQKAHSDAPGADAIAGARKTLGWDYPPFVVPDDLLNQWRAIGTQGRSARERLARSARPPIIQRARISIRAIAGTLPAVAGAGAGGAEAEELQREKPGRHPQIFRKSAGCDQRRTVITIGGSADLTPSNNTKTKNITEITPEDFSGRYIHYGIREHGMCAAMNGMALHGGVIPMAAPSLCSRIIAALDPSGRLDGHRVVFVMTHDFIGVGEDGPTHQPVEQLAAMRAMPGLLVMRPCDGVETAECWQIALENTSGPA